MMGHRIRSFVRRIGRLSAGQKKAIDTLWPVYGIKQGILPWQLIGLFPRKAPLHLEIGFGMGSALLKMARDYPENNYVGIDVHLPGVGNVLKGIEASALENLRIFNTDAIDVLNQSIPDSSLAAVYLFFPDPWPKRAHHKRRIVQNAFIELIYRKLQAKGEFYMATDWEDYAKHMLNVMQRAQGFKNLSNDNSFILRPSWRPLTKFEQRGQRLGHGVWDLGFVKYSTEKGR